MLLEDKQFNSIQFSMEESDIFKIEDNNDNDDQTFLFTFSRFIDFIADSIALTTPDMEDVT